MSKLANTAVGLTSLAERPWNAVITRLRAASWADRFALLDEMLRAPEGNRWSFGTYQPEVP